MHRHDGDELPRGAALADRARLNNTTDELLRDIKRQGPSHVAFRIVPLVGAFFVDIANAFVIRLLLAII